MLLRSEPLIRHGIRRATFPGGEGKGAAAPVQQNDKLKIETLLAVKFQFFGFHTPSKGNDRSSGPKGCNLSGAVRDALSAGTARQTEI